ncbi:GPW/gp25 family protein [Marinobacter sp. X15-166B]|uniref:GPW/gp25 family protein n=1 Tax=Marinobacter sp. X15-166B TaxID=1897620 RepID=UPI00085C4291|nr:GPW/gp25 family protein [Marinobacter sp. X15-166B]OEY67459.1 baseplate assembly protein [Marinobacter sp. X15-166B]
MSGMNVSTGKALTGMDHIKQSITDILTTPLGSRVMRREYGSLLPSLIDQPLNGATLLRAYSAVVVAINEWEPRIRLERIVKLVNSDKPGTALLEMDVVHVSGTTATAQRIAVSISNGGAI